MNKPARSPSLGWLARNIDYRGNRRRDALRARIGTILAALGAPREVAESLDSKTLLAALASRLEASDASEHWLALSVISGRNVLQREVLNATRTTMLDGALETLSPLLVAPRLELLRGDQRWPTVEVVSNAVLVDLQHTSQTTFATGIQRVARETARRWAENHDVVLVGWSNRYDHLRRLSADEQQRALFGRRTSTNDHRPESTVLIPWKSTLLIPELGAEPPRTRSVGSIAEFSRGTVSAIGFDCVPITSAETVAAGMGGAFSLNLAAMAKSARIATISHGAAVEYVGWRDMLQAAGIAGPDITPVVLPVEAPEPSEAAIAEARERFHIATHHLVLVVGSHEPRKNHLAVLHAAELLWREGHSFNLVFVGGNSWNGELFVRRLNELRQGGRPVESVAGLTDDLLWAAYRIAHFTVFPSLNEGFGLPVAESLASGTPAVTSGFGSMAEIAKDGGTLLVDPRDDHELADAMRRLLTDSELRDQLAADAAARPRRSWDDYAAEVWDCLVPVDHQTVSQDEAEVHA
ncbi:glycosyltransferase family 4 protein [Jatrophihabitans sp. DSM 45814]